MSFLSPTYSQSKDYTVVYTSRVGILTVILDFCLPEEHFKSRV